MPISEEAKRRASDAVFELKLKTGALSKLEESTRKEAVLMSALMKERIWRHLPREARIDAAFDIAGFIRLNAVTNLLASIGRTVDEHPELPIALVLVRYLIQLEGEERRIHKEINELRLKMIAAMDRNDCISPEDL